MFLCMLFVILLPRLTRCFHLMLKRNRDGEEGGSCKKGKEEALDETLHEAIEKKDANGVLKYILLHEKAHEHTVGAIHHALTCYHASYSLEVEERNKSLRILYLLHKYKFTANDDEEEATVSKLIRMFRDVCRGAYDWVKEVRNFHAAIREKNFDEILGYVRMNEDMHEKDALAIRVALSCYDAATEKKEFIQILHLLRKYKYTGTEQQMSRVAEILNEHEEICKVAPDWVLICGKMRV